MCWCFGCLGPPAGGALHSPCQLTEPQCRPGGWGSRTQPWAERGPATVQVCPLPLAFPNRFSTLGNARHAGKREELSSKTGCGRVSVLGREEIKG